MPPDLRSLYTLMLKSRLFEEAIAKLWHEDLISGKMQLEIQSLPNEPRICASFRKRMQWLSKVYEDMG